MLNIVKNINIVNNNGLLVVSSRTVAEVFQKEHKHVLESIDNMIKGYAELSADLILSEYTNEQNKQKYREYLLTKKGLNLYLFNIQGYNEYKLAFLNKFEEMEKQLKQLVPTNLKDALLLAYQQQCKIEEQQEQLESQKPLVEFANSIATSSNSISVGDFAKIIYGDFKLGGKKLFEVLRQQGFLMKTNVPYQRYIDNGCFEIMEGTFNTSYGKKNYTKTLITGKGQIYLVEKLKELKLINTKGETK